MSEFKAQTAITRGQLLLSVSVLAMGLVSYGRQAEAQVAGCDFDIATGTYTCAGNIGEPLVLEKSEADVNVIVEPSANFMGPGTIIDLQGSTVKIDVKPGTLLNGVVLATAVTQAPGSDPVIDINMEGAIQGERSGGNPIRAQASTGDIRIVTGDGDIQTSSGAGIVATRQFQVNIPQSETSNRAAVEPIAITRTGDISITTGSGNVIGGSNGIVVDNRGYRIGTSGSGRIAIETGSGQIAADKYGIQTFASGGSIDITVGTGGIAHRAESQGPVLTRATAPQAVEIAVPEATMKYGILNRADEKLSQGNYGAETVKITVVEGSNITAATGIRSNGDSHDISISGDIVARYARDALTSSGPYGILVGKNISGFANSNSPQRSAALPTAYGTNTIRVTQSGSVDASEGIAAIVSLQNASDITVAGRVVGGDIETGAAIAIIDDRTDLTLPANRVELQSGYDITGNVYVSGPRTDDVLALGGDGDLSFDIGKIGGDYEGALVAPRAIGAIFEDALTQQTVVAEPLAMTDMVMISPEEGTSEQFFGFDVFDKVGSGTATLNGTNIFVDNLNIREGTVQLDKTLANRMAIDLIGGRLTGAGGFGSLIARSGTVVSPGSGTGIGTLTSSSNVTFEAGSTFAVNLRADGSSDLIDVGDAARISNAASLAVTAAAGDYNGDDLAWTVLVADEGVDGTFGTVTDNLVDVDFKDVYDGSSVVLTATVAEAAPGGGAGPAPAAPGASDKTNGPASGASAGFSGLKFSDAMANLPTGGSGAVEGTVSTRNVATSEFISTKSEPAGMSGLTDIDMSTFFSTFAEKSDVEDAAGQSGYDVQSTGIAAGVSFYNSLGDAASYQVNLGLGYSQTNVDTAEGAADSDDLHFGLSGNYAQGALRLTGALGYSASEFDLSRRVGAAVATATTDVKTVSGLVEASYDVAPQMGLTSGARLAPLVRLRGYQATVDGYSETGAGLQNLNVAELDSDAVYAGIGLRYGAVYDALGTTLRPSVTMVYDTMISGEDTNAIGTITGVEGAFDTAVKSGADDLLSLDMNMTYEIEDAVEGFVNLGGSLGDDVNALRAGVGLTIRF
ncbi:autotransporter outer membrane beta-barrel domain-containing protein [Loktanella sp. 3ANDIMAR09]|uniref:autotransporter family protein n=1 Tax=Loktanella sp. 3ANDIMAR09 TaxID=1225657 RepID=UPI000701FBA6|nr:autotransporter outer membrane beta-barrel domain-containing protein [Loktanella sp. 3ANDIMAR09]